MRLHVTLYHSRAVFPHELFASFPLSHPRDHSVFFPNLFQFRLPKARRFKHSMRMRPCCDLFLEFVFCYYIRLRQTYTRLGNAWNSSRHWLGKITAPAVLTTNEYVRDRCVVLHTMVFFLGIRVQFIPQVDNYWT